ncbi:MAG: 2-amino-3,7-dideoxy-D-threo-hept-6-ulosonate synthase [Patescibacteria group bacterium]|jgi:predicted phospho-2-dehydro-3-deoxyheptonate aldolase
MTNTKRELLSKIINPISKRTVIVPMDHGVTDGPIPGLIKMDEIIKKVKAGGADAIVIHKGIYKLYKDVIGDLPVFIHISASTGLSGSLRKVLIATAREVKELGAQGVSIHLNLGNEHEGEMLKDLGTVARECQEEGLPLLAMMYPRTMIDGKIVHYRDTARVKHAARVAAELGADIVKVPFTGDAESFREVVEGCPIPVVIAGGAKGSEEIMLSSIRDCVRVGAAGVSVGRNVFQSEDVSGMLEKIKDAVYNASKIEVNLKR